MELGSQVCKPTSPDCGNCPLRSVCKGYEEVSVRVGSRSGDGADVPIRTQTKMRIPPSNAEVDDDCTVCSPLPATSGPAEVTIFPMKKIAKAQREEACAVLVVKWTPDEGADDAEPKWLFVKRPEEGEQSETGRDRGVFDESSRSTPYYQVYWRDSSSLHAFTSKNLMYHRRTPSN